MRRRNARSCSATWFAAAFGLVASNSCSLLYDFDTKQCTTTSDCIHLGDQFKHSRCVDELCVPVAEAGGASAKGGQPSTATAGSAAGDSNTGGTPATGGIPAAAGSAGSATTAGNAGSAAAAGSAGVAGSPAIAGSPATGGFPSAGNAGTAGSAGSAGAAGNGQCSSHAECVAANNDAPSICKSGKCLVLTDDTMCPVIIPKNTYLSILKNPKFDPIIVGAFSSITNRANPSEVRSIVNWDLAFDEFNHSSSLGGLPPFRNGDPRRPLLGLVCQGNNVDITPAIEHLTENVQVTSILSTLSAANLLTAWNFTQSPGHVSGGWQPVFFMNAGGASRELATTTTGGLMWHVLGDSHVLAADVAALVRQIEPYVNAQRAANFANTRVDDPALTPLRVTLIYSDYPAMVELRNALTDGDAKHPESQLKFNGVAAIDPKNNGYFRQAEIGSASTVPSGTNPDVQAGVLELQTNRPHVIVAMATTEFPKTVVPSIENTWSTQQIRPYYVMSNAIYNSPDLPTVASQFSGTSPPLEMRLVGVNASQALDTHSKHLYDAYLARLTSAYGTGALATGLAGTENYYDAAYYLLYSIAASAVNRNSVTADGIMTGLTEKVISGSTQTESVDIGPDPIGPTVTSLNNGALSYRFSLWGTMGAPNFDRTTGIRTNPTSAWCIQKTAGKNVWEYQADGLIYDPTTGTFSPPPDGTPIPACLANYCNVSASADAGTATCPIK
jgi:hypothetical protein